jgi:putative oxidoreductase
MNKLISIGCKAQSLLNSTCAVDFLGPLALRLYLVPILWMAGTKKLADIDSISEWFGNPDWGLGLPFPDLMAWLATLTEVGGGAVLLFFGLATRWISIPLIVTMVVAAVSVHWQNGWLALAEGSGFFATDRTAGAIDRLDKAKEILQEHANYDWITENGSLVILNNGIEFAATYTIMLLVLFFIGPGKASLDYFISKKLVQRQ